MKKMDSKGQGAMEYLMTYGWAIMVVMIVGVVLWQMGIFKMGSGGSGMSGFGAVKPLDHSSTGVGSLAVSFTNGAGARITNVGVNASDSTGAVVNAALTPNTDVSPGDTFTASFAAATLDTACPAGADTYDITLNVSYINSVTGLAHRGNGRVWGPC